MQQIRIAIFLSLLLALSACESPVTDVDVPKVSAQLVLFGFISPETDVTRITLTRSKPVYGSQTGDTYDPVKDAVVTLTNDGGQSVQLLFVDSLNAYAVRKQEFTIEPGRTYVVTAQTPAMGVKASCTVPADTLGFTSITWQKLSPTEVGEPRPYRFTYKWEDFPGSRNYYRVLTTAVESQGTYSYEFCTSVFDDADADGKTITGSCEASGYYNTNYTAELFLLHTDQHYYEYHRRRVNYYGDDPFSEPFPQYSNVQGGLGVFCAYRQTTRQIKIN